ncbi:MAG: ATP-binding cassette domain-containing protein [Synechococcales cyanobacterium]
MTLSTVASSPTQDGIPKPPALSLQGVGKTFGQRQVVHDLDLEIPQGEMFALLGPNGAGKSTTIRMATTLTAPSQGTIRVQGYDVLKQPLQVRRAIGVVVQSLSVDNDLTLWENLEFHGRLHHIPHPLRQERIDHWLTYVELADRRDQLVKTLSGGMKRRLQIARALLHQPEVLFLDEPTVGLDPQARRLLWDVIRDLNRQGMTIILTTHYMDEAELLCDRVGVIDQGRLIEVGSPQSLRERFGLAVMVRPLPTDNPTQTARSGYEFFPDLPAANRYLEQLPDKTGVMIRASNLEDIFVQLTGRRLD